jgi:hypothetical protein
MPARTKRPHGMTFWVKSMHVASGNLLTRIDRDIGHLAVGEITPQDYLGWHAKWSADGQTSMPRALCRMVKQLFGCGSAVLQDDDCSRFLGAARRLQFTRPKLRKASGACRCDVSRRGARSTASGSRSQRARSGLARKGQKWCTHLSLRDGAVDHATYSVAYPH